VQEEARVETTVACATCPCQLAALAMAPADGNQQNQAPDEPAWGSLDSESYNELADVLGDLRHYT